ncbi:MAG TPA: YchJ family protein [Candidatus Limnocylindrales bacterium]|nr:YchJ family protein [Candidatus Limnocylindrales bacterium]
MSECPCGSKVEFSQCCEPFLLGTREPQTAEQMMRSRYTAYTRADVDYLMATLHPDNVSEGDEETTRRWASESQWQGLQIVATEAGGADDEQGIVEFVARYRDRAGEMHAHHERSVFTRLDGKWRFHEGAAPEPATVRRDAPKVGRNDPCPCGSGRKYKKCCERAA